MSNRNSSQRRLENTIRKLVRETAADGWSYDESEPAQFETLKRDVEVAADQLIDMIVAGAQDIGGDFRSPRYRRDLTDMVIRKIRLAMN